MVAAQHWTDDVPELEKIRMSEGLSNKGFDIDLATGQFSESVLADILSRSGQYIEVKSDAKCQQTGNIYLEYESRGKPSGLAVTEAQWWAIEYRPMRWLIIRTLELKEIAREYYKNGGIKGGDYDTSRGVLVPLERILRR